MKLQKSNHTILLVLEKGEDIVECITTFADDQDLTFTSVSGIGACDDVVLKFFNVHRNNTKKNILLSHWN